MSDYHITNERFINPYNFVSIDDDVMRSAVERGELRGVISCELETLSPLFIPNTSNDKTFSEKYSHSYDFFSYEDLSNPSNYHDHYPRPIIPGSSIRGAIRSAFEAASNACMSSCDDENILYRRTPIPRKLCGIIEKDSETGERVLYKATKWKWPINERADHKTGEALRDGIYLRGEDFTGKKNDAIMKYELDNNGKKIELARFAQEGREWSNLVDVWRLYQKRQGNIKGVNQTSGHRGYEGYLNADQIPVYYAKLDNENFFYLSPAAITKEVFSRTLKELLIKQGGHNPCTDSKNLCPVCQLFGMTGEESVASRLMFRDGIPIAPKDNTDWREWYESVRVLPILSGPKISATEFYMEDVDGAAYFNYDYFVNYYEYYDKDGKPAKDAVRSFLDNPKLRGRKFYWHRKNVILDKTTSFQKQRTEIRPVKPNKTFKFEIAFDRLNQEELETLLWVLTFGDKGSTHAHHLGHAKPYGYGSVRITKADVSLISIDDGLSLSSSVTTAYTAKPPADNKSLQEYLALTDYSKANDDVKYPLGDKGGRNGSTVYDWFGINKEIQLGGFNPAFNYVLPKPLDSDLHLPGYAKGNGSNGSNRAEILSAKAPEEQSDIPRQKPSEASGYVIGDVMLKPEAGQAKKTSYTAKDLKIWESQPMNQTFKKKLAAFIQDYESDPDHYKDLTVAYKRIKAKN